MTVIIFNTMAVKPSLFFCALGCVLMVFLIARPAYAGRFYPSYMTVYTVRWQTYQPAIVLEVVCDHAGQGQQPSCALCSVRVFHPGDGSNSDGASDSNSGNQGWVGKWKDYWQQWQSYDSGSSYFQPQTSSSGDNSGYIKHGKHSQPSQPSQSSDQQYDSSNNQQSSASNNQKSDSNNQQPSSSSDSSGDTTSDSGKLVEVIIGVCLQPAVG